MINSLVTIETRHLRRIAFLIGSIFFHGDFVAETANERELELHLRKLGYFFENENDVIECSQKFTEAFTF